MGLAQAEAPLRIFHHFIIRLYIYIYIVLSGLCVTCLYISHRHPALCMLGHVQRAFWLAIKLEIMPNCGNPSLSVLFICSVVYFRPLLGIWDICVILVDDAKSWI